MKPREIAVVALAIAVVAAAAFGLASAVGGSAGNDAPRTTPGLTSPEVTITTIAPAGAPESP